MSQSIDFCWELKPGGLQIIITFGEEDFCGNLIKKIIRHQIIEFWSVSHTNGIKRYCKENTCTSEDQPCRRMYADISTLWLKLNITKSRHLIFVFKRIQYLVEFSIRMKISLNQIFCWLKNNLCYWIFLHKY